MVKVAAVPPSAHFEWRRTYYGELTPLREACYRGDKEKVKRLLALPSADPTEVDEDGEGLLHEVCDLGFVDIARMLLEAGADPDNTDANDQTPLHVLCEIGGLFRDEHLEIAELLSKHHATLTKKDSEGDTPLDVARKHNTQDMNSFLVRIEQSSSDEAGSDSSKEKMLAVDQKC